MSEFIPLELGISSACSVVRNNGVYVQADVTQKIKCCLDQCDKPHSFCVGWCNEHRPGSVECVTTCGEQRDICLDTCELVDPAWTSGNPYTECLVGIDCGSMSVRECIDKNRVKLRNCCLDWCTPTSDIDCTSFCEFAESVAESVSAGDQLPSPLVSVGEAPNPASANHTFVYAGLAIVVACVIVSVWYTTTRRN